MPKRIECSPEEATVAVWGSLEYRKGEPEGLWKWVIENKQYPDWYMRLRGAKFYREVSEPCVVQMLEGGPVLVLQLKECADAQKVYEQVLKVEGVEA